MLTSEFVNALGKLASDALKAGDYGSAAEIARMLEAFTAARMSSEAAPVPARHMASSTVARDTPREKKTSPPRKKTASKRSYPYFERDGDRLVKVGWSKKSREEYEHRAPRDAVLAFVEHLSGTVSKGDVFVVENLMPVPGVNGDEVPAYQVYLTLKWLQEVGVVEKKGRDGYVLQDSASSNGGVEKYWAALSTRKA